MSACDGLWTPPEPKWLLEAMYEETHFIRQLREDDDMTTAPLEPGTSEPNDSVENGPVTTSPRNDPAGPAQIEVEDSETSFPCFVDAAEGLTSEGHSIPVNEAPLIGEQE